VTLITDSELPSLSGCKQAGNEEEIHRRGCARLTRVVERACMVCISAAAQFIEHGETGTANCFCA